jgi:hypothetical protein
MWRILTTTISTKNSSPVRQTSLNAKTRPKRHYDSRRAAKVVTLELKCLARW